MGAEMCLVCGEPLPDEKNDYNLIPIFKPKAYQDKLRKEVHKKIKKKKKKKKKSKGVKLQSLTDQQDYASFKDKQTREFEKLDEQIQQRKKSSTVYASIFTSGQKAKDIPKYHFSGGAYNP